jgi:hypothetical protein
MRASWQTNVRGGAAARSSTCAAMARRSEIGSSGKPAANPNPWATPAPECNCIELAQANIGLGKQLIDHRQDEFAVSALAAHLAGTAAPVEPQSGGTQLRGRIERQQFHGSGVAMLPAGAA